MRNYDAVEFTFRRRFSRNWFGNFSYTWSRLYGNYSGLASSDEILTPTTGLSWATAQQPGGSIAHPARYASLAWDLDEVLFDSRGTSTRGPARNRSSARFQMEWRISIRSRKNRSDGRWRVLYSLQRHAAVDARQHHAEPCRFCQRTRRHGPHADAQHTDLQVAHTCQATESQTLRVEFNVLNLFNQKTSRHRFDNLNRGAGTAVGSSAINLSGVDLRNGYDYDALIRATPDGADAFDPRYGKDDLV